MTGSAIVRRKYWSRCEIADEGVGSSGLCGGVDSQTYRLQTLFSHLSRLCSCHHGAASGARGLVIYHRSERIGVIF